MIGGVNEVRPGCGLRHVQCSVLIQNLGFEATKELNIGILLRGGAYRCDKLRYPGCIPADMVDAAKSADGAPQSLLNILFDAGLPVGERGMHMHVFGYKIWHCADKCI